MTTIYTFGTILLVVFLVLAKVIRDQRKKGKDI